MDNFIENLQTCMKHYKGNDNAIKTIRELPNLFRELLAEVQNNNKPSMSDFSDRLKACVDKINSLEDNGRHISNERSWSR